MWITLQNGRQLFVNPDAVQGIYEYEDRSFTLMLQNEQYAIDEFTAARLAARIAGSK